MIANHSETCGRCHFRICMCEPPIASRIDPLLFVDEGPDIAIEPRIEVGTVLVTEDGQHVTVKAIEWVDGTAKITLDRKLAPP